MYQIVGSEKAEEVSDALGPSFGVKSDPMQLLRGEPGPKVKVGCPQASELGQSHCRRNLVILELRRPLILIVPG
jgi:hypothetical protein